MSFLTAIMQTVRFLHVNILWLGCIMFNKSCLIILIHDLLTGHRVTTTYSPYTYQIHKYSKTCVKQPLKNRQNKDLNDKRYLIEG